MSGISINNAYDIINVEFDWTVRLLNKHKGSPDKYLFGRLQFDGNQGTWAVKIFQQNFANLFESSAPNFLQAKNTLLNEISSFLQTGYIIQRIDNIYNVPLYLQRRRR